MELPTELWKERERGTTHILREIYIPSIVVPSSGDMEGVGSLVAMETNGVT